MEKILILAFIAINVLSGNIDNNFKEYILSKYNVNVDDINYLYKYTDKEKMYVSHAGGKMGERTYTNCLEALDKRYNEGYRLMEMDVSFTTDNVPVMLHSWDFTTVHFNNKKGERISYRNFKKAKMMNDWHQLSLDDVIKLMDTKYKSMYLITDTKDDNIELLSLIQKKYSYMTNRIIPQVYSQEEYEKAKKMGYKNIIYTLYLSEDTKEDIIDFAKREKPFAITMSTSWGYTDLPAILKKMGVYTYCHTINTRSEEKALKANGVSGIYTDELFYK